MVPIAMSLGGWRACWGCSGATVILRLHLPDGLPGQFPEMSRRIKVIHRSIGLSRSHFALAALSACDSPGIHAKCCQQARKQSAPA
ncbi:hypothetical protein BDW75DRAFT_214179 [Aspergillus navahoensis]